MKRILFIIAILIAAISVQAQDYTSKVTNGRTYRKVILSTPAELTNTDTVDVVIYTQVAQPFTIDVGMDLDSISGDPGATLYLEGRKASTETWTAIANTAWSSADGAVLVPYATAVRYREIRLRLISSGTGVTKINDYWAKLWLE